MTSECICVNLLSGPEPMDVDEGPIKSQTVFVVDDDVNQIASHSETDPEVIYVRTVYNPSNDSQPTRRPTYAEAHTLAREFCRRAQNSRQPYESRSEIATCQADQGNQAPYRNEALNSPRLGNLNSIRNPIPARTEVYLVGESLYREMMGSRSAKSDVIVLDD